MTLDKIERRIVANAKSAGRKLYSGDTYNAEAKLMGINEQYIYKMASEARRRNARWMKTVSSHAA